MSPNPTPQVETEPGFSPFVALCFTINYVMGTGFLTLPWAFLNAGLILSILTMFFTGVISDVSKDWVLNAMARAQAIDDVRRSDNKGGPESRLLPPPADEDGSLPVVSHRKFEIISLCEMFLPPPGPLLYTAAFSLYMYGTLWAYATVFGSAMVSALPLGTSDDYLIYILIFAGITVPLTCMELKEQVKVQVALSACRMLLVAVILATVLAAWNRGEGQFDGIDGPLHIPMVDKGGFYKLLPIAVYANIYHHSIPGLSHPVEDKRALGKIFRAVFLVMGVCYVSLGGVVGWYFGPSLNSPGKSSCNLMWHDYLGGDGSCVKNCQEGSADKVWTGRAWWATAAAFYAVLFPALDVLSAFPLNGITLGNCLLVRYHGEGARAVEGVRSKVVPWRVLASLPSIVGAAFVRDLSTITDYTGVTGFVIAFVFPAYLNIRSRREAKRRGLGGRTVYEGWGSGEWASWGGVAFGGFMVLFVLASLGIDAKEGGEEGRRLMGIRG
ncbi:hypothetical protein TrRE_jg5018 [Triparma retinervis]|uniref:Amino acid transporter transmembrane domain-containing protein n=1 Tax=Triparma retinervis TaxID=2557542 RepID=A0A9W7CDQ1_9STRA|nr:hypothetical protein TrRE_jg5018 [Triparma retinervis]